VHFAENFQQKTSTSFPPPSVLVFSFVAKNSLPQLTPYPVFVQSDRQFREKIEDLKNERKSKQHLKRRKSFSFSSTLNFAKLVAYADMISNFSISKYRNTLMYRYIIK
jgi:hypothetical protein